jgi:hypothetical protein
MLRKACLGLLACSAFAGTFLVGMEDADAARRARRRARANYSTAACCTPSHNNYGQNYGQPGQPGMADPGAPPASPSDPAAQPTPAQPPVPGN